MHSLYPCILYIVVFSVSETTYCGFCFKNLSEWFCLYYGWDQGFFNKHFFIENCFYKVQPGPPKKRKIQTLVGMPLSVQCSYGCVSVCTYTVMGKFLNMDIITITISLLFKLNLKMKRFTTNRSSFVLIGFGKGQQKITYFFAASHMYLIYSLKKNIKCYFVLLSFGPV